MTITKPSHSVSNSMKIFNKPTSKVSQAELDALGGHMSPLIYGGADRFFKWRNLFMLSVAAFMLIRLLFFAHDALPVAHALQNGSLDANQYLQFRALYVGLIMMLYVFSYLRDWFYPQVALIVFAMSLAAMVIDTFNFYVFYDSDMTKFTVAMLVLRILVIGCLFLNALYVHRAPAMPRKFWS